MTSNIQQHISLLAHKMKDSPRISAQHELRQTGLVWKLVIQFPDFFYSLAGNRFQFRYTLIYESQPFSTQPSSYLCLPYCCPIVWPMPILRLRSISLEKTRWKERIHKTWFFLVRQSCCNGTIFKEFSIESYTESTLYCIIILNTKYWNTVYLN